MFVAAKARFVSGLVENLKADLSHEEAHVHLYCLVVQGSASVYIILYPITTPQQYCSHQLSQQHVHR